MEEEFYSFSLLALVPKKFFELWNVEYNIIYYRGGINTRGDKIGMAHNWELASYPSRLNGLIFR